MRKRKKKKRIGPTEYDLVLKELKFPGYEDMSIAEFNRRINAVFSGYDEDKEDFYDAYDNVIENMEDTDENAEFLLTTVRACQEERILCPAKGAVHKQVNAEYEAEISSTREEDVLEIDGGADGGRILHFYLSHPGCR